MWVGLQGLTVVSGVLGMCFIINKFRVNLLQHLNWHSTTMSLMNGGMKIIQCVTKRQIKFNRHSQTH